MERPAPENTEARALQGVAVHARRFRQGLHDLTRELLRECAGFTPCEVEKDIGHLVLILLGLDARGEVGAVSFSARRAARSSVALSDSV